MNIVIDGLYGIQSYGDDAMLLALRNWLRHAYPDARLTVLSRHPKELENRYGISAIQNLDHPESVRERGQWFYGFNPGQPRDHVDTIRETIAAADLMIIGGGNLLLDITHDWLRGPIAWHAFSSEIARVYEVPYVLFANSIGPFETDWGRRRSAHIVRNAAAITVRDEDSIRTITAMRAARDPLCAPDPALGVTPDLPAAREILDTLRIPPAPGRKLLAVSVRDLSWHAEPLLQERASVAIAEALRRLLRDPAIHIVFVPQCTYKFGDSAEDDRTVAAGIAARIGMPNRCHLLDGQYRAEQIMGLYKLVAGAFTTRLHGAVFAAAAGTPFLALEYLPKVTGFLRHLALESCGATLDDLADPARIASRIAACLHTTTHHRAALLQIAAAARRRSIAHFRPLETILNRRAASSSNPPKATTVLDAGPLAA